MFTHLVDFLCRCSGIREDALRLAPSGRVMAATQGLLLLAVALFSTVAAGYALHRVFVTSSLSWVAGAVLGPLWGIFIFALDRSLALSFDPGAAPWPRAAAAGVRLALAAIVAMAISTPLILRVAEPVLAADLRQRQREMVEKEAEQNASATGLPGYRIELERLQSGVAEQLTRLRGEPDTMLYRLAVVARDRADQRYRAVSTANNSRIAAARREISTLDAIDERTDEQENQRRALLTSVRGWQGEIRAAAAAQLAARTEVDRIQREWIEVEERRLVDMEQAIAPLQSTVRDAASEVARRRPEAEGKWIELTEATLINQYGALRRITRNPSHPERAALVQVETALHILWFLIEVAVLLMKVSWPRGELDAAIETLTDVNQRRIRDEAELLNAIDQERLRAWHTAALRIIRRRSSHLLRARQKEAKAGMLHAQLERLQHEFDARGHDNAAPRITEVAAVH
ncbi:MAG TPA: DUF4407 domain-containing protein [Vicinamibacterales bacterium]|nr:DUF4407 domain-containing protein [Vicinamibacterales bacterium]